MKRLNKHVIIVGTARSGTSWLSETMARQHRYRMLFEPEHETRTKNGHLICDQWIRKENATKAQVNYINQIFANKVDCNWIAQNSNRSMKRHLWPMLPKKYIIKFVRANLAAHYFAQQFQLPVIHLIRNPYDVIQSQKRVNFPWLFDLSRFVAQNHLVQLIKNTFDYDIKLMYPELSNIELLTLRWCIENVIPLETLSAGKGEVTVVRYEDLFSDIEVFYKLCKRFDVKPIANLQAFYQSPSSKTHPQSSIHNKEKTLKDLTSLEYDAINTILDIFKTRLYSRLVA